MYAIRSYYDGGKMYSIMADDNTQKTKLTDEGVEFINIWGEWIYYVSKDRTLNRVLTDGTNKSVLWEQRSFKLNIIDGWIYFDKGCGEYMERHKMKLDGTVITSYSIHYTKLYECSTVCWGACTGTCSGTCTDSCGQECSQSCSTVCWGACTGTCSSSCGAECSQTCSTVCWA